MRGMRLGAVAILFVTVDLGAASLAQSVDLPSSAPVPELPPPHEQSVTPAPEDQVPVPQLRPDREGAEQEAEQEGSFGDIPLPSERPDPKASTEAPKKSLPDSSNRPDPDSVETPAPSEADAVPSDPRSTEKPLTPMPEAELACRRQLQTLGVKFEDRKTENDEEKGCAMPYPLSVQSLGSGIKLEPQAVMNCAMTETMARFAASVINPAAEREMGARLAAISHASAYVCRPRNGTARLSEHAFGNALDIARFDLANGKSVDVTLAPDERGGRFLDSVRKAACGPFKTVLGPGSNADHSTHFHLDLAPRRSGGTVCE